MLKTLFSRMLVAYLAVIIAVLCALGFLMVRIFRSHYIGEIQDELIRETVEVNRIVFDEYLDIYKRPVAREKLLVIARQYGALLHLYFTDSELGKRWFVDEASNEKWIASEDADLSEIISELRQSDDEYIFTFDALEQYCDVRTLTIACWLISPEQDEQNAGIMLLHYDMEGIYDTLDDLYSDIFTAVVIAVLITIPVAFIISKYITRPVSQINAVVTEFSHGNYDSRVSNMRNDELGRLGESFNDMADKVGGLEKTRRDFVANVSHELRSPLASIHGFLEAMEDGTIPERDHQKYIGVVLDETRRMTGMVNDLLDIARIESGQYKLNLTVFDINELIGRVLITFEAQILAKDIDVNAILGDEPIYVEADRDRIGQVLHNLISNAIKFIPEKGGILTVESRVNRQDVYVSVRDNGPGIPEKDQPHIFDRFYKAEKAHTYTNKSGTGLGLAIVKLVIDQHRSKITLSSNENGTDFTFMLKRAISIRITQNSEDSI